MWLEENFDFLNFFSLINLFVQKHFKDKAHRPIVTFIKGPKAFSFKEKINRNIY